MESRRTKTIVAGGCALMLCAFLSVTLADEPPQIETLTDELLCEQTRGGPIIGESCLPSTAINCSILPIPVGGSCSCSSEVLAKRCKSCDPRYKGVVLETTCTIRPAPCSGPNCDLQEVTVVTGHSCVRTL